MLVSGDKARHDALLPALQPMTGKVVYLGADRSAPRPSSCSAT